MEVITLIMKYTKRMTKRTHFDKAMILLGNWDILRRLTVSQKGRPGSMLKIDENKHNGQLSLIHV